MSTPVSVAQSAKPKPVTTKPVPTKASQEVQSNDIQILTPILGIASVGLALVVVALIVYGKIQIKKLEKKIKFEQFRTRELDKKFKLALETIRKMETNPDLINSREFNLDYLRMRMSEEVFHFAIVNQIKIQVKEKISQALRPGQGNQGVVGIASSNGRQVDEMFDVEYETGNAPNIVKRVLFRIQIRMMKLPTQPTSATISQIIDCVENFLSPAEDNDTWQPTIQGRIAYMHWDQKAKPTPMLVLEQSNEGVNVSFRTSRQPNGSTPGQQPGQPDLPSQPNPPSPPGKKKSAKSEKV
ncbi:MULTISPECIES: hypothetical protein [Nostocales]|uniref:Uncharacterized protein n=3 Tax=Nostocales TaxID=1161 RepID=A0A0C1QSK3_9CYAN|nr:hypothetical protein [Tolypothrix bouteillei]KAF3883736.1 hypothetical protein DA73_0400039080 [Tolypothrix bouteillei VB521301]